ncbi:carboxylesterase/lipase family protein [Actinospica sp. MGRD01-02]|uniref:Carboxylic ester hydrolase n=1 Tax=Actinospica acidithermotolerans TaxID=2828514 RepID=A0A941E7M6_9ACTN|nr:carboxylesterase family protein [Actinospica acidithermotolerans]MBR7827840.1 carboxylesterase/lipase family protein [Actinospica acidithermotolerans]
MQPSVETACGTVRGTVVDGRIAVFRNIPYAAAPIGARRFQPPAPPAPWPGVRVCDAFGSTAPKAPYAPPFDVLLPETDIPGDDYLNLNIWTPDVDGRAPVMVWLHGGAFTNGSGSAACYDGAAFARDGVVLVTLNYRLGADGFLYFEEPDASANLGLLDQIAALRWVRENIDSFGGDPARVTVFGESAGAMSIGALLAMPQAAGLFHRAILQSGAAHHWLDPDSATLITGRLAEILGVAPTRKAFAQVESARLLRAQQALRAEISAEPTPARWGRAAVNLMPFEPVVDAVALPRDPAAAAVDGDLPDVEILIGTNSDEFRLFTVPTGLIDGIGEPLVRATAAAYGLDPGTAVAVYREHHPEDSFGATHARLVTDWFYRIPALRLAEACSRRRPGSAYLYEFAWQPPAFGGRLGACHAAEIPFVFDSLKQGDFAGLLGPTPPQHLATAMHAAWVAFATHGAPGWPAYDEQRRTTMYFDLEPHAQHDPRARERELWEHARP